MSYHFFPESVWAEGSSNSRGLSSHLVITSSHLLIFSSSLTITSSHLLIFHIFSSSHLLTSSHLHIFSHLLILTSSHIFSSSHIFASYIFSHLHICFHLHIFSHLLIFTSAHIFSSSHIFSLVPSCSLALLPSSLSFFSISLLRPGAVPTRRHEMQPFRTKWGSIVKKCEFIPSVATLSHVMMFDRQKLK